MTDIFQKDSDRVLPCADEAVPSEPLHEQVPMAMSTSITVNPDTIPPKEGKGKKSKGRRAKRPKPTGFEKYYVEAPLTPLEYEEENSMYHESNPFEQRIEVAIQRYLNRRKFDPGRKSVFDKYLAFGGIDCRQKAFAGGLDADLMADAPASQIVSMAATHSVSAGKIDPVKGDSVVDFESCLKAFFSSHLPSQVFLGKEEQVSTYVSLILNFLNYLLYHNVCSEYADQIKACILQSGTIETELISITRIRALLPGHFNSACAIALGSVEEDFSNISHENDWMLPEERSLVSSLTNQEAHHVFHRAFEQNASEEQQALYAHQQCSGNLRIVESTKIAFELERKVYSCGSERSLTLGASAKAQNDLLGRVYVKLWNVPGAPQEDVSKGNTDLSQHHSRVPYQYEFRLEDELLRNLEIGMRIEATVHQTNFGFSFFDGVEGIFCSFHTVIPNELIHEWREIEDVWLTPSAKGSTNLDHANDEAKTDVSD